MKTSLAVTVPSACRQFPVLLFCQVDVLASSGLCTNAVVELARLGLLILSLNSGGHSRIPETSHWGWRERKASPTISAMPVQSTSGKPDTGAGNESSRDSASKRLWPSRNPAFLTSGRWLRRFGRRGAGLRPQKCLASDVVSRSSGVSGGLGGIIVKVRFVSHSPCKHLISEI